MKRLLLLAIAACSGCSDRPAVATFRDQATVGSGTVSKSSTTKPPVKEPEPEIR